MKKKDDVWGHLYEGKRDISSSMLAMVPTELVGSGI